jgi:hypothetical protein
MIKKIEKEKEQAGETLCVNFINTHGQRLFLILNYTLRKNVEFCVFSTMSRRTNSEPFDLKILFY